MLALKSLALLLAGASSTLAVIAFSSDVSSQIVTKTAASASQPIGMSSSVAPSLPTSPVALSPTTQAGQVIIVTTTTTVLASDSAPSNTDGALAPPPSLPASSASGSFSFSTTTVVIPGTPWPSSVLTVQTSVQVNSTTTVAIPVPISSAVSNGTLSNSSEASSMATTTTHSAHGPITSVLVTTKSLESHTSEPTTISATSSAGPVNGGGKVAGVGGLGLLGTLGMVILGI